MDHSSKDFSELSRQLIQSAGSDAPVAHFLEVLGRLFLDFSGGDAVELWVARENRCLRSEMRRQRGPVFSSRNISGCSDEIAALLAGVREENILDQVCRFVIQKRFPANLPFITQQGGLWTGDFPKTLEALSASKILKCAKSDAKSESPRSVAVLPVAASGKTIGLLVLKRRRKHWLVQEDVESYEKLAHILALTLSSQFAHAALHERVKELTCLYSVARLTEGPEITLDGILQGAVELLPPAWQYPDITAARITIDGRAYQTARFQESPFLQTAPIVISGKSRGAIDVVYLEPRPELDEGPFLLEERKLIDTVARQIAQTFEQRYAAEERRRLQDQLQHADRLATIGQLAAGVAHELNEPLGNILAFAQLAEKHPELPSQVGADLEKIVMASLHAREIIKKLMLFARQMPPQKTLVDLNAVIHEGLFFLESRCAKHGIAIKRCLSRGLPRITADPSQLNQVLVNLLVNAIQAMPQGGTLKIATRTRNGHVALIIEDDGMGMTCDVLEKIFLPFFTTKDVHEGTGLGLPVVHGIVTAHGGAITVRSEPGQGTRFEIRLPVTILEEPHEGVEDARHRQA